MTPDITPIKEFFALPIDQIAIRLAIYYAWMPLAMIFVWGASIMWMVYIRQKWFAQQKFVILAIDIPRGNIQSPKAVENLFNYLGGAQGGQDLIGKYWTGAFQLSFSFEIVSIGGYIQFIIRTPEVFRDLVESAIYSQYPDAEISEINDYTEGMPKRFPNEDYDVWGWEFIQTNNEFLPIKTYEEFEHQMGDPETHFKDPMAILLNLFSSLEKDEQIWYQIILIPVGNEWTAKADSEIATILGEKKQGKDITDKIFDLILGLISFVSDLIYTTGSSDSGSASSSQQSSSLSMLELKPKQKKQVEAIQKKASKSAFRFKIRMVYFAPNGKLNKGKVVAGFSGYMRQFSDSDLNGLKPDMVLTGTAASYFFAESRLNKKKNSIVNNYISRSDSAGKAPGLLNVEELATLWHFPIEEVAKAPLLKKVEGKKVEAPMTLPIAEEVSNGYKDINITDDLLKNKVIDSQNQDVEDNNKNFTENIDNKNQEKENNNVSLNKEKYSKKQNNNPFDVSESNSKNTPNIPIGLPVETNKKSSPPIDLPDDE